MFSARLSFLTPRDQNAWHFLSKRGALVVQILGSTSDCAGPDAGDYSSRSRSSNRSQRCRLETPDAGGSRRDDVHSICPNKDRSRRERLAGRNDEYSARFALERGRCTRPLLALPSHCPHGNASERNCPQTLCMLTPNEDLSSIQCLSPFHPSRRLQHRTTPDLARRPVRKNGSTSTNFPLEPKRVFGVCVRISVG